MSAAARQRKRLTPEERRERNREYQRRWYANQHPSRGVKIAPVSICKELEAWLYVVQAVERPSGNSRKHIGEGIARLLKTQHEKLLST
jgi:hypothetical protein